LNQHKRILRILKGVIGSLATIQRFEKGISEIPPGLPFSKGGGLFTTEFDKRLYFFLIPTILFPARWGRKFR
jgi:hypothetical protein